MDKEMMKEELLSEATSNYPMVKIEHEILDFDLEMYDPTSDDVINKKISDYKWKWLVIMFYPADFTFVCPTELKDLNKSIEEIYKLWDVEVLAASTDTVFSHKWWVENEKLLNDLKYPMISDRRWILSRYFWILNEETWNSERWTFIIDPNWVLKSIEIVTEPIWRSSKDLIRKLKALKFVNENPWSACPANWNDDMPVLNPSVKIAGHIWENYSW